MPKVTIAVGLPHRSRPGVDNEAMIHGIRAKASTRHDAIDVAVSMAWTSLLPYTFNQLWSAALNNRDKIHFFAMLHDDVIPEMGWLDKLYDELLVQDADLVSAIVPIKDARGLVSTAVDCNPDIWNPRRLTMREVHNLPETFGSGDVGGPVLLNTGCWICRLDRPWCDQVWFRQQDELRKNDEGFLEVHTIPEDWDFSRQLHKHGAKILATRKVSLYHETPNYTNTKPWGQWQHDDGYAALNVPETVAA